ncbi:hypothetical protein ElyMa_004044600 [Elysia marginata]|uniref:Uncharacterized protein n=1 Tax=Elysia marginata TaxID=1093978 RepID=A0AAV4G442_9GAST|nr:hypothetical protein ElyMa_004044600 [Elysia marginata]
MLGNDIQLVDKVLNDDRVNRKALSLRIGRGTKRIKNPRSITTQYSLTAITVLYYDIRRFVDTLLRTAPPFQPATDQSARGLYAEEAGRDLRIPVFPRGASFSSSWV